MKTMSDEEIIQEAKAFWEANFEEILRDPLNKHLRI